LPYPFLSVFFPSFHEVNRPLLPCALDMMFWAATGPKQQSQATMDCNLWNWARINFPPCKFYLRYFITVTQNWPPHVYVCGIIFTYIYAHINIWYVYMQAHTHTQSGLDFFQIGEKFRHQRFMFVYQ
jgi:hypothetical protein